MSQLSDVMKRANVFVDGHGYIGKAVYESPELDFKTEADDGRFLEVNQVVGVNAMTVEVTFTEYAPEVLKLVNICNGSTVPMVFRGSYEDSDCNKISFKEELEIQISNVSGGAKKVGKAETKITGQVHKWKLFDNGKLIYHIDREHFIVNGNDQMKEHINNAGG